ncbi:hypothetical protein GXW82_00620 [Streptacidiphilus sp. 4-A2]|nr:hypothetical protein [Streptacidiphilus sp. 4-A2]
MLARIAVPALRLLARRHPHLKPRFAEAGLLEGLQQLRLGELEVLVITDDRDTALPLPPGVQAQVLSEDEYRVVVPASWAAPATATDLSDASWISAPSYSARGRAFARFATVHGVSPSVEHLRRAHDRRSGAPFRAARRRGRARVPRRTPRTGDSDGVAGHWQPDHAHALPYRP